MKDAGAVAAVTFPEKVPTLMEAVSKLDQTNFKIIVTPDVEGNNFQQAANNVIHYSDLVKKEIDHQMLNSLKMKTVSPHDTMFIPYSSGTTGKPKGVCLTHRNILANNANMKYLHFIWETTSEYVKKHFFVVQ